MTKPTAPTKRSWLLDTEASQLLQEHGGRACEVARKAARTARNKGERKQARHYSHLALRIYELSGQKPSEALTRARSPLGIGVVPTLPARAEEVIE